MNKRYEQMIAPPRFHVPGDRWSMQDLFSLWGRMATQIRGVEYRYLEECRAIRGEKAANHA